MSDSPSPLPADRLARLTLAREALATYRTRCFWHLAPEFAASEETLSIIIAGLRSHGDRAAFQIAARLCH